METPIYTRLEEYYRKNRIPFAMPGHKNLRGLVPDLQKCDVTELAATVDLHHESAEVRRANELLSALYKAERSFIMTGGSTAGVQVMLSSVLKPGDTVLAASDCHMSVINTCALCGFRLRMLPTEYNSEFGISMRFREFGIPTDVKAVIITSPNYYGIVKDIKSIARKCHEADIPLLVDEAHGAHFIGSEKLPQSAVRLGADMVCQSAHKTLNALTGAAYLHISGSRIDIRRVKRAIAAFETSSPSYPIAASADAARATLAEISYEEIIDECERFREAITRATDIRVLDNDDITRIVLNFSAYNISGFKVSEMLSEHFGIDAEMSDRFNLVLIAAPWNRHSDFMELFSALCDIAAMTDKRVYAPVCLPPPVYDAVISPSDGWFAETENISLDDASGRTSASVVTAYPPGTAIIVTGERIRLGQIEYIKGLTAAGAELIGVRDNKVEVVK